MPLTRRLLIMGLFSWLFSSCSPKPEGVDSTASAVVTLALEEGFVDLTFPLLTRNRAINGSQHFVASGVHQGENLGFAFTLPSEWKQGTFGDTGIVTFQAAITIESVGAESNKFIATLRDLYRIPGESSQMPAAVSFTAISLGGDPRHPENGPVKIKLFFEPAEDDPNYDERYAEHYLNIDLDDNVIQFHEKDPEYRPAIIHAFTTTNG